MSKENLKENIQVVVRVRPLTSKDLASGAKSCIRACDTDSQSLIVDCKPEQKIFTFDKLI